MISEAASAKYGDAGSLRARFEEFQKVGILGRATAKEPRRGGAGVWDPMQTALWMNALRWRREGIPLPIIANVPVGLWLTDAEGVELRQAQRAMGFWAEKRASDETPAGPRTLRARAVNDLIDRHASPAAGARARRQVRTLLEQTINALIDPEPLRHEFILALTAVFGPDSSYSPALVFDALRDRIRVLTILRLTLTQTPEAETLWKWTRTAIIVGYPSQYSPGYEEFLNNACATWLSIVGIALSGGSIPGVAPAPELPGIQRAFDQAMRDN